MYMCSWNDGPICFRQVCSLVEGISGPSIQVYCLGVHVGQWFFLSYSWRVSWWSAVSVDSLDTMRVWNLTLHCGSVLGLLWRPLWCCQAKKVGKRSEKQHCIHRAPDFSSCVLHVLRFYSSKDLISLSHFFFSAPPPLPLIYYVVSGRISLANLLYLLCPGI